MYDVYIRIALAEMFLFLQQSTKWLAVVSLILCVWAIRTVWYPILLNVFHYAKHFRHCIYLNYINIIDDISFWRYKLLYAKFAVCVSALLYVCASIWYVCAVCVFYYILYHSVCTCTLCIVYVYGGFRRPISNKKLFIIHKFADGFWNVFAGALLHFCGIAIWYI